KGVAVPQVDLESKLPTTSPKIRKFLLHIKGRQELVSVPKGSQARLEFYTDIENYLKAIIHHFKNTEIPPSFVSDLVQAAESERGDHYYYTCLTAYHRLCKCPPASFEEEIMDLLESYRRSLLQRCLDPNKEVMISQHNFVMRSLG